MVTFISATCRVVDRKAYPHMVVYNLPKQLAPFIGRETEIAEINVLLSEPGCRLLSLIGAGGMGKTRLALEIAEQKSHEFRDGVYFVSLQALTSSGNMASAVALALKFEFYDEDIYLHEQLVNFLVDKDMLLVMDNFEHILDGADLIADILFCAPNVKILVTSREALKLQQEWIRPVTGMSYPDTENCESYEIDSYSAVQLFVEHAQQFRRNFDLQTELPHIIRICQLVGGMPLGIELAVAWLKTLSCAEIASEIEKNFDLLTAQMRDIEERHQSIRIIFDATWEMLTTDEQTLFMQLSIFRDKPTRQAIQTVTNAHLLTLSSLADKALLIPVDDGHYQVHELLRQYAYEKLQNSDEYDKVKNEHSLYYLKFLADRHFDIQGRRQVEAIQEIKGDFENIRKAWIQAIENRNIKGIAGAIETFCNYLHFRSLWKQESYLITQADKHFAPAPGATASLEWAMIAARNYLNHEDRLGILQQTLVIAHEYDDPAEIGLNLFLIGFASLYSGNEEDAVRYTKMSLPYFIALDDTYHQSAAYSMLARYYTRRGDYETCMGYNEKSLSISRASGDIDGEILATSEISNTMFIVGNFQEAEKYRREAILLAEHFGRPWTIAWQKWEWATYHVFARYGDLQEAKIIIRDASDLNQSMHIKGARTSSSFVKSLFAGVEANYDEAIKLAEEAYSNSPYAVWRPINNWGLLISYCGKGDYTRVRELNHDLQQHFWDLRVVPILLLSITFSAILIAYDEKNPKRATELLALASTHRSSMSGWMQLWTYIDELKAHLQDELGHDNYETAWQKGQNLEWELVVSGLLAEYEKISSSGDGNGTIPEQVLEANAQLFEPLSERELEVLFKIGEGHTNREIAEELFVGISTVKKHITHIYGKLEVENRTQALLKAQEWKLI